MKKAKTTSVAKPARPARQAAPSRQKLQQEVSTLQSQVRSLKHKAAPSRKHKASGTAKHSGKRGLALSPGDVACCAAQALAESLRLALGEVVHGEDVLALYWRTAAGPDDGASILATLEAAREYGISGYFPAGWRPGRGPDLERNVLLGLALPGLEPESWTGQAGLGVRSHPGPQPATPAPLAYAGLPGPHTVAAGPDGTWWSWGEPYDPASFPGAVIEECWAVTW